MSANGRGALAKAKTKRSDADSLALRDLPLLAAPAAATVSADDGG